MVYSYTLIAILMQKNSPRLVSVENLNFTLVSTLVKDVIIELKVLGQHQSITLERGGKQTPLRLNSSVKSQLSATCSKVEYPTLFPGSNKETKPVRMASRKYSKEERTFIAKEVKHLLEKDIIEESVSLCWSQIVVVKEYRGKQRL